MRIYRVKAFARFQRREGIADAALVRAIRGATRGLVDADLGDGIIKQRVARRGQGKRGGYRTIIAYQRLVLGNGEGPDDELDELKAEGRAYLVLGEEQVEALLLDGDLTELSDDAETDQGGD